MPVVRPRSQVGPEYFQQAPGNVQCGPWTSTKSQGYRKHQEAESRFSEPQTQLQERITRVEQNTLPLNNTVKQAILKPKGWP